MDRFEAKLLKLIFKAGTSNLLNLDESKLKYNDRLTVLDYINYNVLTYNKKKDLPTGRPFHLFKRDNCALNRLLFREW